MTTIFHRKPYPVIFLSLLLCSSYSQAYYCTEIFSATDNQFVDYQWTSSGYFNAGEVVRHKGIAYRARVASRGEEPYVRSWANSIWRNIGTCTDYAAEQSCDFNGDGKMDIARGFPNADLTGGRISSNPQQPQREDAHLGDAGEVAIYYGGSSAPQKADMIWNQNKLGMFAYARPSTRFGQALSAGDFNKDGFCDLAIGAPSDDFYTNPAPGMMNILYGSTDGLTISVLGENGRPINPYDAQRFDQDSPNVPESAESGDLFGKTITAGDFNGDGYNDLAVGAPREGFRITPALPAITNAGYLHIFYGSRQGIQTSNPPAAGYFKNMSPTPGVGQGIGSGEYFADELASADFDKDGYDDLVVSSPGENNHFGKIRVFRGGPNGLDISSKKEFILTDFPEAYANQYSQYPSLGYPVFGLGLTVLERNKDAYPDLYITYKDYNFGGFVGAWLHGSASGLGNPFQYPR